MNVFYLDSDPKICAQMHIDKHSSKMCIEYAQLLSTAHRVVDGSLWYGKTSNNRRIARYLHPDAILEDNLYKASHINHPSNIWARQSAKNYLWLYDMWVATCNEYKHRYGRVHESFRKLEKYLISPPSKIGSDDFSEPPPAMKAYPQCIVEGDSLTSYRNYYWEAKRSFAKWTKRDKPIWWNEREDDEISTKNFAI